MSSSAQTTSGGDWPSWQEDLSGSRFNGAEHQITQAVVGGAMYFGVPNGKSYSLDAKTGATR
jgi:polyvinyl alcohol dehydrogenase (cytochrome)